jgi:hypothetical protein
VEKRMDWNPPSFYKDTKKIRAIILKCSEPLLYKGYTLWMGNYCDSPGLAKFLRSHKTMTFEVLMTVTMKNTVLGDVIK